MTKIYLTVFLVLSTLSLSAQQLLKDLTPFNSSSEVNNTFVFNGKLYFTAFSDQTNSNAQADHYSNLTQYYELWNTNGTTIGTSRLTTQNPIGTGPYDPYNIKRIGSKLYYTAGNQWGYPLYITDLTTNQTIANTNFSYTQMMEAVGGTALFFGDNSTYGLELYKTDGTIAGTTLVKDITAGSSSSYPSQFIVTSTLYFFVLSTTANGQELWRSDGTDAGTYIVKDIASGTASSNPQQLTVMNNEVYFTANDGINGTELWKTDGTTAGTVMVKDINLGSASANPQELAVINNKLYFSANDGVNGTELWTSLGTEATTLLFKDIQAGASSSTPKKFTVSGSFIYFIATTSTTGTELWKTDGTSAGTTLVKDIRVGDSFDYYSTNPPMGLPKNPLTDVNGLLYFFTYNGSTYSRQLWKTDGSEVNTVKVADVTITSWLLTNSALEKLYVTSTHLYYAADDGTGNYDIWVTDGTPNSAQLLRNINPTNAFTKGRPLTVFNNEFYFTGFDATRGQELFKTNGTGIGTVLVKDINTAPASSKPLAFVELNGEAYFIANNVLSGPNLFKSDGTSAGTFLLGDFENIYTATAYSPFSYSTNTNITGLSANNGLIFLTQSRNKIWKTNGINIPTILAGPGSGSTTAALSPTNILPINDQTYFVGDYGGGTSFELWKSDGNTASIVKDIAPSSSASFPDGMTNVNETIYFRASTSAEGTELWKSDGTNAGTVLVKDIATGSSSSSPRNLTNVNGTLYFTASTSTLGTELWKSDGTNAGTVLVKDITAGSSSSFLSGLTALGNNLIFYNSNTSTLYVSDGTDAGTTVLTTSNAITPVAVGNVVFFSKNSTLWKTDGTVVGTSQVASFNSVRNFTNINGILYFSGKTSTYGEELWRSDGTAAGTVLVADINAGTADSSPSDMKLINGKIYFSAYTPQYGREPWVINHCPQYYSFVNGPSNMNRNTLNYESSNAISANNKIVPTANVTYDAGSKIELLPGFVANTGSVFTAKIDGCGSSQAASGVVAPTKKEVIPADFSPVVHYQTPPTTEVMPTLETFFNQPDGSIHRRRFADSSSTLLNWSITKTMENDEYKVFVLIYTFENQEYTSTLIVR